MKVATRAPVRIDFAGGWSDVPIFAGVHGGRVVNAAVASYVHVDFQMGGGRIRLHSDDFDERIVYDSPGAIVYDGKLDLHKAALNLLPVTGGIEISSRSDVPAGSGLGSSGALDVALVTGLARCRGELYEPSELAEMGFMVEAAELKLLGGRQDQYAAALGGFLDLTFGDSGVIINALPVSGEMAADLERHVVLVYTGHSHFSSETHERVWASFAGGVDGVDEAIRAMRDIAPAVADALVTGDWKRLGHLIDQNWIEQQRLDPSIAAPSLQVVEKAARGAGAWGVKATGAGAGGCLVAICPPEKCAGLRQAVLAVGGQPLDARFEFSGVQANEIDDAAE